MSPTSAPTRRCAPTWSGASCASDSRRRNVPKIEEVQVFHWGWLQPTPVEIAVDDITVATGPNGSGKTTFLDALKVILGVVDLKQPTAQYIYNGAGDPDRRARRAVVKATFANPVMHRNVRAFAHTGSGCETASHVTALCEVTPNNRRWALLARHRALDPELDPLVALDALLGEVAPSAWQTRSEWQNTMRDAGVSRALLGVIAVEQGQTARVLEGSPAALLRTLLELTGKQETADAFTATAQKLTKALEDRATAERERELHNNKLERLFMYGERHAEFVADEARHRDLQHRWLPAARRAEAQAERHEAHQQRDRYETLLGQATEKLADLQQEIEPLQRRQEELQSQDEQLHEAREKRQRALTACARAEGALQERVQDLDRKAAGAHAVLGRDPKVGDVEASEREAEGRRDEVRALQVGWDVVAADVEDLRRGQAPVPADVRSFAAVLTGALGTTPVIVAEALDDTDNALVEAALSEHLWAVAVATEDHERAVALAVAEGFRRPVAILGRGDGEAPTGALSGAEGGDDLCGYLTEIDVPLGRPGLGDDGVLRSDSWAVLRSVERPALGRSARTARLASAEGELASLREQIESVTVKAQELAERAHTMALGWSANAEIAAAREELTRAVTQTAEASEALRAATSAVEEHGRTLTSIQGELVKLSQDLVTTGADQERAHEQLVVARTRLSLAEAALQALPAPSGSVADSELLPSEVYEQEAEQVAARLAPDSGRYPEEARDPTLPALVNAQRERLKRADALLTAHEEDVEAVRTEVDRARERYDLHINQVIDLLAARFREVCAEASIDGVIEPFGGVGEEPRGVDVRVAHVEGGERRSYRSKEHSTGERAKIAILLLLAAMSIDRAADLLIMDEQFAHLDSRNIDDIAEVMVALRSRVQFILATPTNAEARRLHWCEHQLVFHRRRPEEPYAPPVQLLTTRPADDARLDEPDLLSGA